MEIKHWKWQCFVAAPAIPWLLVNYTGWLYDTGLRAGFDSVGAAMSAVFFLFVGMFMSTASYCKIHEDDA